MLMKLKFSYYSLISLLFCSMILSCNNKVEEKTKKDEFHPTLFLTLSPYMSDDQFYNESKKLNQNNTLEKGKFVLRLNNKNYFLNVDKYKHSITLSYSKNEEVLFSSLSYERSDVLNNKYEQILNDIKLVYDKKYIKNDKQIPLGGFYPLGNLKYTLYKDKDKYILFGYKLIANRIGNKTERQKDLDELNRQMGRKAKPENSMFTRLSSNDPKITFGIKIKIDYFEKGYIDSLLVKFDKDIKDSKLKEQNINQLKEKENLKRKENINNI